MPVITLHTLDGKKGTPKKNEEAFLKRKPKGLSESTKSLQVSWLQLKDHVLEAMSSVKKLSSIKCCYGQTRG